ncbi:MAG TPA: hypothetical protein VMG82_02610 [Candidatus Sulfotelmatobacter sp.]|nr:hypothetical protein [Candidatus Sulfotelmatobacter sp.]
MTRNTQRDQVFFGVIAGAAAELLVMNFKIAHGPAGLASPTITL